MQPVTNVLAITLSVLTSLSQWFGEGMQAVKQEKYEAAAAAFTRVIEAEAPVNPLKETALYWRAHSFAALKQNEKAAKDLETLVNANPGGPLMPIVLKSYKEWTGKEWGGLNLATPEGTWRTFLAALRARNVDLLLRCCTGKILEELADHQHKQDFWDEGEREVGDYVLQEIWFNSASNKVCAVFTKEGKQTEKLLMLRAEGLWLIADSIHLRTREEFEREFGGGAKIPQQDWELDTNKLRQLQAAVDQFTLESGAVPARLEDVKEYVKDFAAAGISAVNGKPWVFVMPTASGEGLQMPWIFMSSSVNGKRLGAIDDDIKTLTEEEFQRLCRQRGVKVAPVIVPVAISAEEEKQIRQLIRRLGAKEFKDRQAAYEELKKLGMKAGKLLEEAQKDPDPEIALQAKKLLSEL